MQTGTPTDRQTDRQTARQAGRQTDRHYNDNNGLVFSILACFRPPAPELQNPPKKQQAHAWCREAPRMLSLLPPGKEKVSIYLEVHG